MHINNYFVTRRQQIISRFILFSTLYFNLIFEQKLRQIAIKFLKYSF